MAGVGDFLLRERLDADYLLALSKKGSTCKEAFFQCSMLGLNKVTTVWTNEPEVVGSRLACLRLVSTKLEFGLIQPRIWVAELPDSNSNLRFVLGKTLT